jgi:hypothetical protein
MNPTAADYRNPNRLILRAPMPENRPVTAEVASSSLVVPAILFSKLRHFEILSRCTLVAQQSGPKSVQTSRWSIRA